MSAMGPPSAKADSVLSPKLFLIFAVSLSSLAGKYTQVSSMTDPWLREDKPFNLSATGYLGKKRPQMLKNCLLKRCPIGRARDADHGFSNECVFGTACRCPFTVANAMVGWKGVLKEQESPKPKPVHTQPKGPPDFLQYNSGATSMGLSRREEFAGYRNTRKHLSHVSKLPRVPPLKVKPFAVYGVKSVRHEETMTDLIAHTYHRDWFMNAKEGEYIAEKVKPNFKQVKPNLATKLRNIEISRDKKRMQQRPRYLHQVKPHLSTFRSESARQRAWKAFEKEIFEMEGNPFPKLDRKEAVPRHLLLHSPVDLSRHSGIDLYRPPPHSPRPCCLMTMEDKILSWK